MNQPIPLFHWFQAALEYAIPVYLAVIIVCIFIKKARKYDIIVTLGAIILIGASLFRLMAWGRTIVNTDRSLHYLTLIVGLLLLTKLYEKAKSQQKPLV
ncbi:MAG: hypothetical protein WC497_03915 [Patescibacteria group bacterium]